MAAARLAAAAKAPREIAAAVVDGEGGRGGKEAEAAKGEVVVCGRGWMGEGCDEWVTGSGRAGGGGGGGTAELVGADMRHGGVGMRGGM